MNGNVRAIKSDDRNAQTAQEDPFLALDALLLLWIPLLHISGCEFNHDYCGLFQAGKACSG